MILSTKRESGVMLTCRGRRRMAIVGRIFVAGMVICFGGHVVPPVGWAQVSDVAEVVNTQKAGESPPTPAESRGKIEVPAGFQVTLFAGEPHVRQPIAMDIDDRGRLWVVECYSYTNGSFLAEPRDRIVVFSDDDHDGRFDTRKVFWDQGQRLSGIALGFGGVWLTSAPNLLYLPDADRNDQPDGPPQVMLDGFDAARVEHNIVNGLCWGPGGWLYGRHGILATSRVGRPGTPLEQRVALNCAIWRFHPIQHRFEVVAHGTTNPWGLDFDDRGHLFFTNNVIGHLFHVVPGAHFERMYGSDLDPLTYELMGPCADHYHWDTGVGWQQTREGVNARPELGGGHSHCGGMIYLGDNWPAEYRNNIFMCNVHGKRVNRDALQAVGSGYVATHRPDFLFAHDGWFRGIDLLYGPDGGVYVSDWSDLGECHDHDGVHRTSGRIYKVVYGDSAPLERDRIPDLQELPSQALLDLQAHTNDWYVRHARRILQERAAAGMMDPRVRSEVMQRLHQAGETRLRLRWLWAAQASGALDIDGLRRLLSHEDADVRGWAIRLLADRAAWPVVLVDEAIELSARESVSAVRMEWASALRRMPNELRLDVARGLSQHEEDRADRQLSLMIWYGVQPAVSSQPENAVGLVNDTRLPVLRRLVARRITELIDQQPAGVAALADLLRARDDRQWRIDVLTGMQQALQGRQRVEPPQEWTLAEQALHGDKSAEVVRLSRELSVVFGNGRALSELRALALDRGADVTLRRRALEAVIAAVPPGFAPQLQQLLTDRDVEDIAARGLSGYDDPHTPRVLLEVYSRLDYPARQFALATLASRSAYARAMLQAVERKEFPRAEISPYLARQLADLGDAEVGDLLSRVWGSVRTTSAERRAQMAAYRQRLTETDAQISDPRRGRAVFDRTCATCHKLFGAGASIGPDLTGGNRGNLDYLLENIVDPSATVAADYRTSIVELVDGRVLNGVVVSRTEQRLVLQTQTELHVLPSDSLDVVTPTSQSLMPDGLLGELSEQQIRDLMAYLASPQQVAPRLEDASEKAAEKAAE